MAGGVDDETGAARGSGDDVRARALIGNFTSADHCVTLCHMKRTTVRELHLQTSAIVRAVAEGESYIVEKAGVPGAEIRPPGQKPHPRLPNREAFISRMKKAGDSGPMLEEDRA